jgi:branched-chain amino acid transport system substrate-binding protein
MESTKAYINKYRAAYSHAMNGFSPAFYDATRMMLEAISRSGSISDTTAAAAELEKISGFPGASGTLSWSGKKTYGINHQVDSPFYIAEVVSGAEVIRARCSISGGCVDAKVKD